MSFSRTNIIARLPYLVSGTVASADMNALLNMAVSAVVADCDLYTTKRKATITPQLFNDVFSYAAPSDLKDNKIIDLQPRHGRGKFDDWTLVPLEEFDRKKQDRVFSTNGDPIDITGLQYLSENLLAVSEKDATKRILVSKPLPSYSISIDGLNVVGDWVALGDAENLEADNSDSVDGIGSLKLGISDAGGTTAGITNSNITDFDITDYLTDGSFFVWAYITDADDITNFILKAGSDSSNYYSITITTTNESTAFVAGWNLLRFAMSGKSTTGTPDDGACDYIALYMTKDAGKVSEVGYRFDNLTLKRGEYYDIFYYSEYGWRSAAGTWAESATSDTDILNGGADELKLVEMKYSEFAEKHLRQFAQSENNRKIYEFELAKYKQAKPSEALPLTNAYFEVELP